MRFINLSKHKMKFININNSFWKVLTVIVLMFTAVNYAFSQTDTLSAPFTLNGHKFVVNSSVGSPFVSTYYKNVLGVGQTTGLEFPVITINNKKAIQLQGQLAFSNLSFSYQQEIRDWMAFYGEVKLVGRLGTEAGALISQGVNIITGYNMGWKFKLYQNERMSLSSNINVSRAAYTVMDLKNFIQTIIDSGGITKDNKLVQNVPLVRGGVGFNYAYVFNKTFGATAKLYLDYGESVKRGEDNVFNYNYGLAVDADLLPNQNVPLGFLAGFYHSSVPVFKESTSRDPNEVIFQINYTGKKYLNIGAEIIYQWYKVENYESNINFITLNLNSTIYF
jgi:hypothetical protein